MRRDGVPRLGACARLQPLVDTSPPSPTPCSLAARRWMRSRPLSLLRADTSRCSHLHARIAAPGMCAHARTLPRRAALIPCSGPSSTARPWTMRLCVCAPQGVASSSCSSMYNASGTAATRARPRVRRRRGTWASSNGCGRKALPSTRARAPPPRSAAMRTRSCGCGSRRFRGMPAPPRAPRTRTTWRCCAGRARTAAHSRRRHARAPRSTATLRCSTGRTRSRAARWTRPRVRSPQRGVRSSASATRASARVASGAPRRALARPTRGR
mmetsp:Transcript_14501/g.37592  ORF Transcript_14501/g.37592 Transcript_14501/m.37592 type:complete len:269 (-) Transcript_14501:443-1249(-)